MTRHTGADPTPLLQQFPWLRDHVGLLDRQTAADRVAVEAMEQLAYELLAAGLKKGQIKKQLAERFGVAWRACESLIGAGRQRLVERYDFSAVDAFLAQRHGPLVRRLIESAQFWRQLAADPAARSSHRPQACQRLSDLLGLDAQGQPLPRSDS
jgi:hypothetical protein